MIWSNKETERFNKHMQNTILNSVSTRKPILCSDIYKVIDERIKDLKIMMSEFGHHYLLEVSSAELDKINKEELAQHYHYQFMNNLF